MSVAAADDDSHECAYEFEFPVERGMILQFAHALGDPNAVYADTAYARAQGFADVLAPPTFAMAADGFDPRYPRRPASGREGLQIPDGAVDAWLHVSQQFEYSRHVTAGEVLTVRRLAPREWEKQGRKGGRLQFVEYVSHYVGPDGAPAITTTWTDVLPERGHQAMSIDQPAEDRSPEAEPPGEPGKRGERGVVVAHQLSRTQLVMYVGVAGDFHPLHHDDEYARAHGYPSVFAPGMLTMGLTARAVTDAIGDGVLRRFGGRLTGQVWPGATLRVTLDGNAVTTTDERGRVVFDGEIGTEVAA